GSHELLDLVVRLLRGKQRVARLVAACRSAGLQACQRPQGSPRGLRYIGLCNALTGDTVILHKFWSAFVAQINKVANLFWEADPVAQMRYEYDRAVEQLKEGRTGLEQYRGLVERVTRQVAANRSHAQKLEAETRAYLKAGDR